MDTPAPVQDVPSRVHMTYIQRRHKLWLLCIPAVLCKVSQRCCAHIWPAANICLHQLQVLPKHTYLIVCVINPINCTAYAAYLSSCVVYAKSPPGIGKVRPNLYAFDLTIFCVVCEVGAAFRHYSSAPIRRMMAGKLTNSMMICAIQMRLTFTNATAHFVNAQIFNVFRYHSSLLHL